MAPNGNRRTTTTREALRGRHRLRFARFVLAATAGALLAASTPRPIFLIPAFAQVGATRLLDLQNPAALRDRFNADRGNLRLVLLLSPT